MAITCWRTSVTAPVLRFSNTRTWAPLPNNTVKKKKKGHKREPSRNTNALLYNDTTKCPTTVVAPLRKTIQVRYLDAYLQAVRLFSDCVLCSRIWSKARRVSRSRSGTSLRTLTLTRVRRESAPLPTTGAFGSLTPQRQTHELVQGMNAPSGLLHLSSHRSLPLFSLLTCGHARMPAAYRPARYATAARHALATQLLALP